MDTITKKIYKDSFSEFKKEFGYSNDLEVPRLEAVSINVGIKATDSDNKFLTYLAQQVSEISGQKAVLTKAKKSYFDF